VIARGRRSIFPNQSAGKDGHERNIDRHRFAMSLLLAPASREQKEQRLATSPWTDRFVERLRELGWSDLLGSGFVGLGTHTQRAKDGMRGDHQLGGDVAGLGASLSRLPQNEFH
jgi:hypothetical protein